jgi:hypothetical protein
VLAAGRRAALDWAGLLAAGDRPLAPYQLAPYQLAPYQLTLYQPPELDIVSYFPAAGTLSGIDAASARVLAAGMADPENPVFVSTLRVTAEAFARRHPSVSVDAGGARILRSVLMKPESETRVGVLHHRLQRLAAG